MSSSLPEYYSMGYWGWEPLPLPGSLYDLYVWPLRVTDTVCVLCTREGVARGLHIPQQTPLHVPGLHTSEYFTLESKTRVLRRVRGQQNISNFTQVLVTAKINLVFHETGTDDLNGTVDIYVCGFNAVIRFLNVCCSRRLPRWNIHCSWP